MTTEGIITLGIGSSPGDLKWFFTLGLAGSDVVVTGIIDLTARPRGWAVTARARDFSLTARSRD